MVQKINVSSSLEHVTTLMDYEIYPYPFPLRLISFLPLLPRFVYHEKMQNNVTHFNLFTTKRRKFPHLVSFLPLLLRFVCHEILRKSVTQTSRFITEIEKNSSGRNTQKTTGTYCSSYIHPKLNIILRKNQPRSDLAHFLHEACFAPAKSTFI